MLTPEQREIDELRADNKRKAHIIYVLNKLVIELKDLCATYRRYRHSCVLERKNHP